MDYLKKYYTAFLCFVILILGFNAKAQISYDTWGSTYEQDFNNGLPNFDVGATWTDNTTFEGWYAYFVGIPGAPATYSQNSLTGHTNDDKLYQWRSSEFSTDGALGTLPEIATDDIITGVRFTNDTGNTLTSFDLGYTGEQWFKSTADQNNQLIVAYQIGSPADLSAGSWTTINALDFNSLWDDGLDSPASGWDGVNTGSIDGSDAANQTVFAPVSVSITWDDGDDLWIRWYDDNSSGVDQGLAIDDISFSAIPEPSTIILVLLSFFALLVFKNCKA